MAPATITPKSILVKENTSKNPAPLASGKKPDHWVDARGSGFVNPWQSWRSVTTGERLGLIGTFAGLSRMVPTDAKEKLPVKTPTWGKEGQDTAWQSEETIKTTWLGHACFFVEFPSRSETDGGRGVRVLFDPVFSDRCSPSQWIGPKRFTPPPCRIEDIPEVDAIVISHNHYDHLDTHTIQTLFKQTRKPHIFAPLGNGPYFNSIGVPKSHTHIMDWWDSKLVEVELPSKEKPDTTTTLTVDITCTPGQHFTGRSILDNFKTLWSSWVVEEVSTKLVPPFTHDEQNPSTRPPVKLYFAGDTGYRSVMDGQNEDEVPVCPVFKQIGERFRSFDCALIPIGAYMPRQFMSPIHCAPQDSVRIFKDINAKKALGMHWATWILTTEDVYEPPKRLAEECKKAGIEDGAFTVCDIGETFFF